MLGRHSTNELDALLLVSPTIFRAFEPLIEQRLKFEIQEAARRFGWHIWESHVVQQGNRNSLMAGYCTLTPKVRVRFPVAMLLLLPGRLYLAFALIFVESEP